MTQCEALQLLAILKAAYPHDYKNITEEEADGAVSVWCDQFSDMPSEIVFMAVKKAIGTSDFSPTIAAVKRKLRDIHWEAHEALVEHASMPYLSPQQVKKYDRICELTEAYRHNDTVEMSLWKMLSAGNTVGLKLLGT